ncbi:hypothetical protein [Kitasatospora sp. NPDC056184]|uniref:hypothetical protein n=1 Tax=Kitasatospora sp. NPDC056184 TaxID=3345738 RepID=UPI0035DF946B
MQEVVHGAGEPVRPAEYTGAGDVDGFRSGTWLKRTATVPASGKVTPNDTWRP